MNADLLSTLLRATLAGSAAVVLVMMLRGIARRYFGPRLAYALWAMIPILMLVTALPAPTLAPMVVGLDLDNALALPAVSTWTAALSTDSAAWWLAVWFVGTLASAATLVVQQRRFVHGLGPLRAADDGVYRASRSSACPAAIGLLRPRIVVPVDFETRYDGQQRALIIAHERVHIARGDLWANALAAGLRCIGWFNPLVYFATARFRFDQELACDAIVLSRFPKARRSYASAMLKTQLTDPGLPVGCHWQSSHPLKKRIIMLKQTPKSRSRRLAGGAFAFAFGISGSFLVWAAQPPEALAATGADHGPIDRSLSAPSYPDNETDEGLIVVNLHIDAQGQVNPASVTIDRNASSGSKALADATIAAAKTWTFHPAVQQGKPVASDISRPVTYSRHGFVEAPEGRYIISGH